MCCGLCTMTSKTNNPWNTPSYYNLIWINEIHQMLGVCDRVSKHKRNKLTSDVSLFLMCIINIDQVHLRHHCKWDSYVYLSIFLSTRSSLFKTSIKHEKNMQNNQSKPANFKKDMQKNATRRVFSIVLRKCAIPSLKYGSRAVGCPIDEWRVAGSSLARSVQLRTFLFHWFLRLEFHFVLFPM